MDECPNNTVTDFYISAFSTSDMGQFIIFAVVLMNYLISVIGNSIILIVICSVLRLHTPMYFFLSNLSIVDIIYISSTIPKLLYVTVTQDHRMSFPACVTQLYVFITTGVCDILILTSMSYDRYVAICIPLKYSMIMDKGNCVLLAASSWVVSSMNSIMYAWFVATLSFCSSRTIDHFFCDLQALYAITTSDTGSRKILMIIENVFVVFIPFSLIITSYVFIISTILKIRSTEGRIKTFSSCTSHLTTVILFYVPILFLYTKKKSIDSTEEDKIISLLYLAIVPMLNPFVYTFRNKEFLGALKSLARNKIGVLWKSDLCGTIENSEGFTSFVHSVQETK
ncbi:olfactory receptor-like protein OLF3 [Leptodactylus fuscus]|uniref:olfactory receptor-like protein OLF3 n=1 Tax=Leptodactylus fuscus TaxID=238119 RepID=UPI003F4F257F